MKHSSFLCLGVFVLAGLTLNGCASGPSIRTISPPATTDSLRDLNGDVHDPLAPGIGQLNVVIFTMTDCPIANAYTPEVNRLVESYGSRGVRFYLVHTDPDTTVDDARRHAADYKIQATVLTGYRAAIGLAKQLGATITPQAVVINHSGGTVYSGRINNFYEDFGVKRAAPNKHELRDALEATLGGGFVAVSRTEVVGCTIPMDF